MKPTLATAALILALLACTGPQQNTRDDCQRVFDECTRGGALKCEMPEHYPDDVDEETLMDPPEGDCTECVFECSAYAEECREEEG